MLAKCNKYHKRIIDPTIKCYIILFVGLAYYQGKDIVLDSCIEYSSLRDFWPLGLFLYGDFSKMKFWLVLNLEINYQ
jgi:hypothetical protein